MSHESYSNFRGIGQETAKRERCAFSMYLCIPVSDLFKAMTSQQSYRRSGDSFFQVVSELFDFERLPFRRFSADLYEINRTGGRHVDLDAVEIFKRSDLKRRRY